MIWDSGSFGWGLEGTKGEALPGPSQALPDLPKGPVFSRPTL